MRQNNKDWGQNKIWATKKSVSTKKTIWATERKKKGGKKKKRKSLFKAKKKSRKRKSLGGGGAGTRKKTRAPQGPTKTRAKKSQGPKHTLGAQRKLGPKQKSLHTASVCRSGLPSRDVCLDHHLGLILTMEAGEHFDISCEF